MYLRVHLPPPGDDLIPVTLCEKTTHARTSHGKGAGLQSDIEYN